MVNHWVYGLVKETDGLVLSEVYFDENNQLSGRTPISYDELNKESIKMIIKDLKNQLSNSYYFSDKDFEVAKHGK